MDWNAIVNQVVQALIPIVVSAAGVLVTLAVNEGRRWLKAKAGQAVADTVDGVLTMAVKSANQYLTGKDGQAKKAYALELAQAELSRQGISVDLTLLDKWIEAAVADHKTASGPHVTAPGG